MNQQINEKHDLDANGNPTGGETAAVGILVHWQNGPLGRGDDRKAPNGAFVEGVIAAARGRLHFYQTASGGRFACAENALAIAHLDAALEILNARTAAREARQVEGTHKP